MNSKPDKPIDSVIPEVIKRQTAINNNLQEMVLKYDSPVTNTSLESLSKITEELVEATSWHNQSESLKHSIEELLDSISPTNQLESLSQSVEGLLNAISWPDQIESLKHSIEELLDATRKFSYFNSKIEWTKEYSVTGGQLSTYWKDPESEVLIADEEVEIAGILSNKVEDLFYDEIAAFYTHLMKFPMLGLLNETGQKLLDWTKETDLLLVKDVILYRARQNESKEALPFVFEELFTAPYGNTGFGRFNFIGHNFLYLCETEEIAKKEVAGSSDDDFGFGILKLKLIKEVKLLDLTNTKNDSFHKFIHAPVNSKQNKEYLLPNFVAYCAKYNNIDGVKYNSTKDNEAVNYVLFNATSEWFEML